MKAMVLTAIGHPLVAQERVDPLPLAGEVRIRIEACAVCRTDGWARDGQAVCGGIHMSDIPAFPHRIPWEERQVLSVADLARGDGILVP